MISKFVKIFNTLILLVFFIASQSVAQKKEFTYEDIIFNSYGKLAPEKLKQLNWNKTKNEFYWTKGDTLYVENVQGDKSVFTLSEINSYLNYTALENQKRFPQ